MRERLSFPNHLPVAAGIDEIVCQKRSDLLRIARLCGICSLLLESGDRLLGSAAHLFVRSLCGDHQ